MQSLLISVCSSYEALCGCRVTRRVGQKESYNKNRESEWIIYGERMVMWPLYDIALCTGKSIGGWKGITTMTSSKVGLSWFQHKSFYFWWLPIYMLHEDENEI